MYIYTCMYIYIYTYINTYTNGYITIVNIAPVHGVFGCTELHSASARRAENGSAVQGGTRISEGGKHVLMAFTDSEGFSEAPTRAKLVWILFSTCSR